MKSSNVLEVIPQTLPCLLSGLNLQEKQIALEVIITSYSKGLNYHFALCFCFPAEPDISISDKLEALLKRGCALFSAEKLELINQLVVGCWKEESEAK